MGFQPSPRSQILQALSGAFGCELDDLVKLCPELEWHQIFLEVDHLSRRGALHLIPLGPGRYRLQTTKSELAAIPPEDAGGELSQGSKSLSHRSVPAGSVSTGNGRFQGEYEMNTIRLTRDRLFAWHQYAREDHRRGEQTTCAICGYHKAGQPWGAVVQWLEREGFAASKSEDGMVKIRCLPGHTENDLYRLIAGRGTWI